MVAGTYLHRRRCCCVARSCKRRAVVTGAASRFGAAIVRGLSASSQYQELVLVDSDEDGCAEVIASLKNKGQEASILVADLSSMAEVQDLCGHLKAAGPLHCLLCAAGAKASHQRRETVDGLELHFGLDFLSRFLMVRELRGNLAEGATASEPARVLLAVNDRHWGEPLLGFPTMGSPWPLAWGDLEDLQLEREGAHSIWRAFGQAALCNIFFSYELQRQCFEDPGGSKLAVTCFDPGPMTSAWQLYQAEENRMRAGSVPTQFHELFSFFTRIVQEPEVAASLPVMLAATEAGTAVALQEQRNGTLGHWQLDGPRPSKFPLPWSRGSSYDEAVGRRLWAEAEALLRALEL